MKKINLKTFFLKILFIGVFFVPFILFAESEITVQQEEISVEIIPENPEPYEGVTIRLTSYATDIDKAIITWQSNTGTVQSGIGLKSYSFKAPGPNEIIYFDVSINPANETSSIKKRITISPSDMELMWESVDGYVPPFYKGKNLPSRGSAIKVVAIPSTNAITSGIGDFDYTWKNSDQTLENSSGYNKNAYVFKNSLFNKTESVEVQVSSVKGNYNAQKSIEIPTYNPFLVFYKKSPTDGILFNNAIVDNYKMTEDIATFVSSPYYLTLNNRNYVFNYNWSANDDSLPTPSKRGEITIALDSDDGYADIELAISSLSELFQEVTKSFRIKP
ncbi:MAG: hypothetical protein EOM85_01090 [Candidatus Moranbacteria bacterium]|nr:hypothetical protein [Candidatus Moranbacteria bacterium]